MVPFGTTTHKTYLVNADLDVFDIRPTNLDELFNEMELAIWHDFIITTKRNGRLLKYLKKRYGGQKQNLPTNIKFRLNNEQVRGQIFLEYGLNFLENGI